MHTERSAKRDDQIARLRRAQTCSNENMPARRADFFHYLYYLCIFLHFLFYKVKNINASLEVEKLC